MDAGARPQMLDFDFDCISCSDLFWGGAVREGWIVEHELYPPFLGSVVKFVRGDFRPCCSYDRLYPEGPFQLYRQQLAGERDIHDVVYWKTVFRIASRIMRVHDHGKNIEPEARFDGHQIAILQSPGRSSDSLVVYVGTNDKRGSRKSAGWHT